MKSLQTMDDRRRSPSDGVKTHKKQPKHHVMNIVLNNPISLTSIMKFDLGCRGRDFMVVRFTTTYAISAYHH